MTIESSQQDLLAKMANLRGALQSLEITIGDAPANSAPVTAIADATVDSMGAIDEVLAIVGATKLHPQPSLQTSLPKAQERFSRAFSRFLSDILEHEGLKGLQHAAKDKGREWIAWTGAVHQEIARCHEAFLAANEAFLPCWREVTALPVATEPARAVNHATPDAARALAYAQKLFDNHMDWYKTADSKAQIILGLDGAFLTFLTGSAFAKGKDAIDLLGKFGIETWLLLGLMCVAMTVSMFSAIACLWSRTYTNASLKKFISDLHVDVNEESSYSPNVMWFFQMVRGLKKPLFEARILEVDDRFATRALASQIYELSGRVASKHNWLHLGFVSAAVSLTALLGAAISYVIRTVPR